MVRYILATVKFVLYKMYMSEVGMTNYCPCINHCFRTSRGIELGIPFIYIFFLISLSLQFEIDVTSQDVCCISKICIFIIFFIFWCGSEVMNEDEGEAIASLLLVCSLFCFPRFPYDREPS